MTKNLVQKSGYVLSKTFTPNDREVIFNFIEHMEEHAIHLCNPNMSDSEIYKFIENYLEGLK